MSRENTYGQLEIWKRGDWVPVSSLSQAHQPTKTGKTATTRTTDADGGVELTRAKLLMYSTTCSFNSCVEQRHKDGV